MTKMMRWLHLGKMTDGLKGELLRQVSANVIAIAEEENSKLKVLARYLLQKLFGLGVVGATSDQSYMYLDLPSNFGPGFGLWLIQKYWQEWRWILPPVLESALRISQNTLCCDNHYLLETNRYFYIYNSVEKGLLKISLEIHSSLFVSLWGLGMGTYRANNFLLGHITWEHCFMGHHFFHQYFTGDSLSYLLNLQLIILDK